MKKKLRILISAGPTHEPLDPVRYLTNRSSGKMGYALAESAVKLGHTVVLVSGPTALTVPFGCQCIPVVTAKEMLLALKKEFVNCDVLFMVAAVADYRVKKIATKKLKKSAPTLRLDLVRNPDILNFLSKRKKPHQTLVGFSAETHRFEFFAQKKLKEKRLDWIVLNNVLNPEIGFESDDNAVMVMSAEGQSFSFEKQNKKILALKIMKSILK